MMTDLEKVAERYCDPNANDYSIVGVNEWCFPHSTTPQPSAPKVRKRRKTHRRRYDGMKAKQRKGFTLVQVRDYMPPTLALRGTQRHNGRKTITLGTLLGR